MPAVVAIRQGKLEGDERRGGVLAFRGIPYAAPPVGKLRFRAPQPAPTWQGTRDATRFRPSAPQAGSALPVIGRLIGAGGAGQSEDCLFLNVWTPATDGRRRPVMVWIHGGAFAMGSGSTPLYSGRRLAQRGDVVVVTINYRLGALGGLNLAALRGAADAGSNQGIRDQIAALEWVRDNIEAFGGDPGNVTIFGESAGGMSVGTLLGTPRARGLFHRAIAQSGAAHNVSSRDHAARIASLFLSELRIRPDDDDALANVSLGDVLRAQSSPHVLRTMRGALLAWQPSVDGDVLPRSALETIAAGEGSVVPLLVGTNLEEWNLFMLGDPAGRRLDDASLRKRLARALPGADEAGRMHSELALESYRVARSGRGGGSARRLWSAFQSDRVFHYPATRLAELMREHTSSVHAYLFAWGPPLLGAAHGMEIPFVFGTLRNPVLRPVFGLAPSAHRLSRAMQQAWISMARSGRPEAESVPHWPAYDAARRPTMVFERRCAVEEAPFEDERRFWSSYL